MSPSEFSMLRDRVTDWLFECCPGLLQDDIALEGILFLVVREVQRAAQEQRARRINALQSPRTFELN